MDYPRYFDPKNSQNLFNLENDFNFLSKLYSMKKLPNVLLLSGFKGIGKSTLINHFLFSIFDEKNYDKKNNVFSMSSSFYTQFKNNIFQNIIYLKASDFKSIKVEDIRNLKSNILKSSIIENNRFVIFDDIELFNTNSLNALLKIIEEPSKNNYFILINNKKKPLIETIKSRALELKITLSEDRRIDTINKLVNFYNIEPILDPDRSKLSPGNFMKFDYIFNKYKISIKDEFLTNLSSFLNLFKKNKDVLFIDLVFYITDFYFQNLSNDNIIKKDKIYTLKNFVLSNLNKYFTFNISQNSLINAIENKFKHG